MFITWWDSVLFVACFCLAYTGARNNWPWSHYLLGAGVILIVSVILKIMLKEAGWM